jgi:uncharacterized protein
MKKSLFILLLISNLLISQNNIKNDLSQPTIDVVGKAIVKTIPDEVTIKVQLENKGKNPQLLKQKNDIIINDILFFLNGISILEKYVKTTYLRLNKNYDYQTKSYNYVASQSISIFLTDLNSYELLMNGLMNRGINRVDGILFSSSIVNELKSEARKKAIENAKMKAKEYAGVLNQSIGKAVSISEFSNKNNDSFSYKSGPMQSSESPVANQQTISIGEIEIVSKVNVSFLLN